MASRHNDRAANRTAARAAMRANAAKSGGTPNVDASESQPDMAAQPQPAQSGELVQRAPSNQHVQSSQHAQSGPHAQSSEPSTPSNQRAALPGPRLSASQSYASAANPPARTAHFSPASGLARAKASELEALGKPKKRKATRADGTPFDDDDIESWSAEMPFEDPMPLATAEVELIVDIDSEPVPLATSEVELISEGIAVIEPSKRVRGLTNILDEAEEAAKPSVPKIATPRRAPSLTVDMEEDMVLDEMEVAKPFVGASLPSGLQGGLPSLPPLPPSEPDGGGWLGALEIEDDEPAAIEDGGWLGALAIDDEEDEDD
jgi:hypothetical protein